MTILAVPTSNTRLPTDTGELPARQRTTSDAIGRASGGARADPPVTTEHLLRAHRLLPPGHPDRDRLRTRAIEDNLSLANQLAYRYAGRGERRDDLAQVAALALVRAVDGYDPNRATPFVSYAIPTILGALKRHFRDSTWAMRVPRSTQQLLLELPGATADLTQLLRRSPTPVELADYLKVSADDLNGAARAAQVYRLPSLDAATGSDGEGSELGDLIGDVDPRYTQVEEHLALRPLVAALPPRERHILTMRFYDEMTQDRIATEIGISQMHVSRLLKQALAKLRTGMLAADTPSRPAPSGTESIHARR